jgi:hypothetical protein
MKKKRLVYAAALVLAALVFFVSCNKDTHPSPLIVLNSPASLTTFHKADSIPISIYMHDKDGLASMKLDVRVLTQDNTYQTVAVLLGDSLNISGTDYTYARKLKVDSMYHFNKMFCRMTINTANTSGTSGKYVSDFYVGL